MLYGVHVKAVFCDECSDHYDLENGQEGVSMAQSIDRPRRIAIVWFQRRIPSNAGGMHERSLCRSEGLQHDDHEECW